MTEDKEKHVIEELFRRKKELLCRVLEISGRQKEYLDLDDVEALVAAVDERQKLIDEIMELDKYINDGDVHNEAGAQEVLSDIKNILQDIALADKINIKAAEGKVEHFKQQVRNVKNNKNRLVSYQNAPVNEDGIYIDKKK